MHRLQSHCSKRINLQKPLNCKLHRSKLTVQLCTPHFRAYNIKVWYCPLDLGFRGMGSKMIKTQWDWSNRHWEITGVQGLHYDGCIVMAASCTAIVLLQQHCTACCRSIAARCTARCTSIAALQHCRSIAALRQFRCRSIANWIRAFPWMHHLHQRARRRRHFF